jgi:predicted nucleotidyltransferase
MLLTPLDEVLGAVSKVRTLRLLFRLDSSATGREVEKLAGIKSRAALRKTLHELVAAGILLRGGTPSTHMYQVNPRHQLFPELTLLFHAESKRIGELADELRGVVERSGSSERLRSLVVFGSNARGDAQADSDLDLLAIVDAEPSVVPVRDALLDADGLVQARFGFRISPYVLSIQRVRERYEAGDPLMQAVEAEGRTLLGSPFHQIVRK